MHDTQIHSPEIAEITPQDIPHTITVTTLDNSDRDYDWTHPENCPDGENCDIRRRLHRARNEELVEMVAGRPDGTYRLGRFGFHGLDLVDERGILLPDVVEAMSPAAKAALDNAREWADEQTAYHRPDVTVRWVDGGHHGWHEQRLPSAAPFDGAAAIYELEIDKHVPRYDSDDE